MLLGRLRLCRSIVARLPVSRERGMAFFVYPVLAVFGGSRTKSCVFWLIVSYFVDPSMDCSRGSIVMAFEVVVEG